MRKHRPVSLSCHLLLCHVCCLARAVQGRQAYLERRAPDFSRFKRLP